MPLVKVCQNGDTTRAEHPAAPMTPEQLASDARACRDAGAGALHFHVYDPEGAQTLEAEPTAAALQAVRAAVPGMRVGLSTAIDIVGGDAELRLEHVSAWTVKPDFVSLNISEPGADTLAALLLDDLGVGVEAGTWAVDDIGALAAAPWRDRLVRVLIEPWEEDGAAAVALVDVVEQALDAEGLLSVPRLHHGTGFATWAVIDAALERARDVRIGLEDTTQMPDGSVAPDNAAMVAAVVQKARSGGA
jgi:uncharacterized protein (DUF849 family)